MKLTSDQIGTLMKLLGITRDQEYNCNECLDQVGEFAELQLSGASIPNALDAVEHHLQLCVECSEEYESLLKGLKALDGE
jgi:hypothetical protein